MDFGDTPEEAAFRAEAHAFLARHASLREPGEGTVGFLADTDPEVEAAHIAAAKAWQATLYREGWAGVTWPKENGGRGGSVVEALIFAQEEARFDVPPSIFAQGIGMAGPTLIAHGTEAQKARFLPPMLEGTEVWCQLFSEPGAGSDLASLRTAAVRDGDELVVTGQKVWTSSAHFSDWGMLLVRTDPDAPKHRGITFVLVDMRSPGIDVRPIRQINGASHFSEVFLTDVRVPLDQVVGPVDGGWGVAMTTLMSERIGIGSGGTDPLRPLVALVRAAGKQDDPVVRQDLARIHTRLQVITYMGLRVQTALSQGQVPGPESSVLKLAFSTYCAALADFALAVLGPDAMLFDHDAPATHPWQGVLLTQWAVRIGGGTEQVQRNIIGERALGLPREPRPA
ncbi:acyl-CoA dehydrogenase [Iamia sp. SCSIO 61187]|uniref:acyl-CoA dehydrogenase family protein n=1 Tax=Iamia sp. SCSIO 61187 TaxID=2722752 RepID=UPI001C63B709|nr:acyl-CoA dehydrogenase family protein [Iamia sp. SCSIO 61187]QYG91688.1 acyl-CoA dehydrogenase [Iamia sp. SCSIO 61187]